MGLLDDLKKEAESVKDARARAGEAAVAQQQRVRETLDSLLADLYRYFKDLGEQLNVIDPDLRVDYAIDGVGELTKLRQGHYRVTTDDLEKIEAFTFHYTCAKAERTEFKTRDRESTARQKDYFWRHNLRFEIREAADNTATFAFDATVPVSFAFSADPEHNCVQLRVRNFDKLGLSNHRFPPDRIDRSLMEEVAKRILHKPNRFAELSGDVLPDDARARLRERLERDKALREREGRATAGQLDQKPSLGKKFSRTWLGRK